MKAESQKSKDQRKLRNPLQPVSLIEGVMRFKKNKIVDDLLDFASSKGLSLNDIALRCQKGDYSQDDYEQLMQLIGYSICGFHEISFVSDETALEASKLAKEINPDSGGCRDDGCEIHIGVERK